MTAPTRSWTVVGRPWAATVDLSSPEPSLFYVSLVREALRYGRPAARSPRLLWTTLGRVGVPERATAAVVRAAGRLRPSAGPSPQVGTVLAAWDELVARDPSLPAGVELSVLELHRAAARTAFFFAPGNATPLVVAKTAHGTNPGVHREAAALRRAAPAGAAPAHLGSLPGVDSLQRGLPGRALRVTPLRAAHAGALAWSSELAALAASLGDLAAATSAPGTPAAVTDGVVDDVLAGTLLSADAHAALAQAVDRVRARSTVVLGHTDVSPQNVLMDDGRLSGLVDWEEGEDDGLPGADVWNAGLAWLEQGIGLVRWTERDLLDAFTAAWFASPFGTALQAAATDVVVRSGTPAELTGDLELVWFARHLGYRMQEPGTHPTSAEFVARQLELLVQSRLAGGTRARA